MPRRIGILGLGTMGSIIASRLLDAGHELWVHNRSAERARALLQAGASWAENGDDLAGRVELLITMVSDDTALEAVALGPRGVLAREHPGLVYADMSTVSPAASGTVAAAAAAVGTPYLRAPVTGSTALAEAGALGVLASGPQEALTAFSEPFSAIAERVFHLGDADEARVMKLALNTLVASTIVGLSEALVLGERSGLDRRAMLDVFAGSAVASPLVRYKAAGLAEGDFRAAFTTELMAKDLAAALVVGRASGAAMPMTALSHELLRATCGMGWADRDFSAAVLMYEAFAGGAATA